ncbi:MAG: hypothetical protein KAT70_03070 [Thermoplasmata archaeon]|nr:hypothetical protein [Thermoplasmata archaeon]
MDDNHLLLSIESTIHTIINQFHRKPHNFFNEHEFHQYCYHVFYGKKEFTKQYSTIDGKRTNILKPEYPTIARFRRKDIVIDPKGTRARYDMAILNPDFIQNNGYKTVINRDISASSGKEGDLFATMEFKYITGHRKEFQHEIDYDHFKLTHSNEAVHKYMLVFANTIAREIDYFASIPPDSCVNIVYCTVWEESGEKRKRVVLYPNGWLDDV